MSTLAIEMKLDGFMKQLEPQLKNWRRVFHSYPEIGWSEYWATYQIGKELKKLGMTIAIGEEAVGNRKKMGLPHTQILTAAEKKAKKAGVPASWLAKMKGGKTGLAAQWDTGKPGKHVAFRFDIDALPITETCEASHTPFVKGFSSNESGIMHACGHDGHMAIGLGLAHCITHFQHDLKGRITLLFQPAEEGGRGAAAMVQQGWLDDVDEFISGHIGIHPLQIGEVAASTTQFLASTKMDIFYKGQAAHAGIEPEKGQNALLACAAASLHLQGISRHSAGMTRINIGRLEAGTGRNIISDTGRMEMETRGETAALNDYMETTARRIIKTAGDMYQVSTKIDVVGKTIDAVCDKEWIARIGDVCKDSKRINRVIPEVPFGGSEDATLMMRAVQNRGGKAVYLLFGTPIANGHHHPAFDFDENVLIVAVELLARILLLSEN